MRLLLLLLLLTACSSEYTFEKNPRLIAFGDSNTRASAITNNWVRQLSISLRRRELNLAVDGTVIDSPDQLQKILSMTYEPTDMVVFLTGYNDYRYFGLAGLAQYEAALTQAVEHLREQNVKVYIATCLRMPQEGYTLDGHGQDDTVPNAYRNVIYNTVAQYGGENIAVVDVQTSIQPSSFNFLDDYRHLNQIGHNEVAQAFLSNVR